MARTDPRAVTFALLLFYFILFNPQQQVAVGPLRDDDRILRRERAALDVLNSSNYGDFEPREGRWLNVSGLRSEDQLSWHLLKPAREKATQFATHTLGTFADDAYDGQERTEIPVFRNLSGSLSGKWARMKVPEYEHIVQLNTSDGDVVASRTFDRNITGASGEVAFQFLPTREDAWNSSVKAVKAVMTIEDTESFGTSWGVVLHGVQSSSTGAAVLTTTSEK